MELIDPDTDQIYDPYEVSKQLNRTNIKHFNFISYD